MIFALSFPFPYFPSKEREGNNNSNTTASPLYFVLSVFLLSLRVWCSVRGDLGTVEKHGIMIRRERKSNCFLWPFLVIVTGYEQGLEVCKIDGLV